MYHSLRRAEITGALYAPLQPVGFLKKERLGGYRLSYILTALELRAQNPDLRG